MNQVAIAADDGLVTQSALPVDLDQAIKALPADLDDQVALSVRRAAAVLAAAGCDSPRHDAEHLAAQAGELPVSKLRCQVAIGADWQQLGKGNAGWRYKQLIEQRAHRQPLQWITGKQSFYNIELSVGPGVFLPRPETEVLAQTGLACLEQLRQSKAAGDHLAAIDLCTGSGAIAAALAKECPPGLEIWAVEMDSIAAAWARRNLADHRVNLIIADATRPIPGLAEAFFDLVICNPPYLVEPPQQVEARYHDPPLALYGGGVDGLAVFSGIVNQAKWLLGDHGWLVMEHGDDQAAAAQQKITDAGGFDQLDSLPDLTGRQRFVRARRCRKQPGNR